MGAEAVPNSTDNVSNLTTQLNNLTISEGAHSSLPTSEATSQVGLNANSNHLFEVLSFVLTSLELVS